MPLSLTPVTPGSLSVVAVSPAGSGGPKCSESLTNKSSLAASDASGLSTDPASAGSLTLVPA